ncbi:type II secretion system F family protein [Halomonas getboli]|uniref:type II secretion system F family protein n=1 Tax=Halomonas getboli TaxID=2935862 RepID=UPI0020003472|nr:type II secretion system F family protein [Halomonas getboli]MCK2183436.1 type II secretion system F family protein [Halomonas getboli]
MSAWQLWCVTMVLLLLAARLLWRSANHESDKVLRLNKPRRRKRRMPSESLMQWLLDYLLAAGVHATPRGIWIAGGVILVVLIPALMLFTPRFTAPAVLGLLLLINLILRGRAQQLRRRVRARLPGFMEQVVRDLGTGATIEIAFRRNGESATGLLREATARINIRRELGMELHEALRREAQLIKLTEFDLLATAVEVNQTHGGSLRDILGSFIDLLRQQEKGRRELRALTGETRVTAFVLAAVPVAMAAFMWFSNPEFLAPMLESGGGRLGLWAALLLELGGCVALWRMLKSI